MGLHGFTSTRQHVEISGKQLKNGNTSILNTGEMSSNDAQTTLKRPLNDAPVVPFMYKWLYMDLHGFTWIYMDLFGFIWIYMGLHGFTWIYQKPFKIHQNHPTSIKQPFKIHPKFIKTQPKSIKQPFNIYPKSTIHQKPIKLHQQPFNIYQNPSKAIQNPSNSKRSKRSKRSKSSNSSKIYIYIFKTDTFLCMYIYIYISIHIYTSIYAVFTYAHISRGVFWLFYLLSLTAATIKYHSCKTNICTTHRCLHI